MLSLATSQSHHISDATSLWEKRFDSSIKSPYYYNQNGSVRFDNPKEVVTTSSTFSSTIKDSLSSPSYNSNQLIRLPSIIKNKLLSKRKLSICNKSKNHNKNKNRKDLSTTKSLDNNKNGSADSSISYESNNLNNFQKSSSATNFLNQHNYTYSNDVDSMISMESYVSSVNESVVNEAANLFYNGGYSSTESEDVHSLTIMNPDEFNDGYYNGNIDEYDDSDIESLHDDQKPNYHPINSVPMIREDDSTYYNNKSLLFSTVDEDDDEEEEEIFDLVVSKTSTNENNLSDDCDNHAGCELLTKQLNRELLRFEEEEEEINFQF